MPDYIKTLFVLIAVAIVGWFAWTTAPRTDNCSPSSIARYTNIVISHQECVALGVQCVIIPRDIERFHSNQMQLEECITRIIERAGET